MRVEAFVMRSQWSEVAAAARAIEEAGFDSLAVPEIHGGAADSVELGLAGLSAGASRELLDEIRRIPARFVPPLIATVASSCRSRDDMPTRSA